MINKLCVKWLILLLLWADPVIVRKNNIALTKVLAMKEMYVLDKVDDLTTSLIKKYIKQPTYSKFFKIVDPSFVNKFTFEEEYERNNQFSIERMKIIDSFYLFDYKSFKIATITQDKRHIHLSIREYNLIQNEKRSYKEQLRDITEDKINLQLQKRKKIYKIFDITSPGGEFNYQKTIKDFFYGFLVIANDVKNLEYKFFYHIDKRDDLFDYDSIGLQDLEKRVNIDIRNYTTMNLENEKKVVMEVDFFPIRDKIYENKYQKGILWVRSINVNFYYMITIEGNYLPTLLEITTKTEAFSINEYDKFYFLHPHFKHALYDLLKRANLLINIDDEEEKMIANLFKQRDRVEKIGTFLSNTYVPYRFLLLFLYTTSILTSVLKN